MGFNKCACQEYSRGEVRQTKSGNNAGKWYMVCGTCKGFVGHMDEQGNVKRPTQQASGYQPYGRPSPPPGVSPTFNHPSQAPPPFTPQPPPSPPTLETISSHDYARVLMENTKIMAECHKILLSLLKEKVASPQPMISEDEEEGEIVE